MHPEGFVSVAGQTGLPEELLDLSLLKAEPNIATPRYWITHGLVMTEERRATLEPKRRLAYAALGVMEGHLMERAFFVGDRYSVADIALYAYTHVAHEGGFDLDLRDAE